jgi:hypothetical protein
MAAVTGQQSFIERVAEEFADAVSTGVLERAERLATIAFGVEEARKALEELQMRSA